MADSNYKQLEERDCVFNHVDVNKNSKSGVIKNICEFHLEDVFGINEKNGVLVAAETSNSTPVFNKGDIIFPSNRALMQIFICWRTNLHYVKSHNKKMFQLSLFLQTYLQKISSLDNNKILITDLFSFLFYTFREVETDQIPELFIFDDYEYSQIKHNFAPSKKMFDVLGKHGTTLWFKDFGLVTLKTICHGEFI